MADFGQAEVDWASFCAMPDKVQPVKMPSLFPIPTHIVRRRLTKTIDAYYWDKLMWSPEYVYGQGALIGKPSLAANIPNYVPCSNSVYDHALSVVNGAYGMGASSYICQKETGSWAQFTGNQGYMQYYFDTTAPLQDAVSAGGQRLIGAVIEIEYLGKVDDIQGIVEISMNTNTVNTKHAYSPLEDMNFMSEDAIQQAPYYRRFRLSEGIRSIWFPMDESRFTFNECFQTVDKSDPILGGLTGGGSTALFDANQTRCWIFPTKNIGSLHASVGNFYLPPGAHQYANGPLDTKTPYRQDNECLHDKTRLEWAINFTGLTQACPVRIYINQYYETVPHEAEMDNFFPTKGPVGNTDAATKLIQRVAGDITPTPSNSSGSTVSNILSKIWEIGKRMGPAIMEIPGVPETFGTIAGGFFGGPVGATAGIGAGSTARKMVESVGPGLERLRQTEAKPSNLVKNYRR